LYISEKVAHRELTFVSIFQLAVQRAASTGECPISQKIGDGPINMALPKNKKCD
jgi:hypothetical protein